MIDQSSPARPSTALSTPGSGKSLFSRETIAEFFRTALAGPLAEQLRGAQRETILERTNVLVWIGVFGMPTTCLLYVYFLARDRFELATWMVAAAVAGALCIRALIARHVFDRYYHLAMVALVGGVFGPLASAIMEITRGATGDFFFSFFMIYFSFTALYPAETKWILATSCTVIASFLFSHAWRPGGVTFDGSTTSGIIYLLELSFMSTVMNRTVYRLFFDEKRARFELAVANAGLRELDRAKSSFFSNISHEIRTPLTLILAPLSLVLETDRTLPPNVREKLEQVRANALRLLKMVNSLLDFAKVEAGLASVQISEVNIDELVEHVSGLFAATAERKDVSLVVKARTGGLVVMSDADKLDKVLVNLLGNAVKFTPAGGTITVEATRDGKAFSLRVSDTGPGVPAQHREAIFERFTQLENSQASVRGTGIGLSMVREYAKLLGGNVSLESEVGKGSTFSVNLPVQKVPERVPTAFRESPTKQTPTAQFAGTEEQLAVADLGQDRQLGILQIDTAGPGKPRVLVVDDNPALVNLVSSILEPEYNLYLGSNGADALSRLATDPVNLVISDVMMPGITGLELVKRMRNHADERVRVTPVILLTARGASAQKVEGLDLGADDYIGKPFDPNELRARVRSLFELRRTSAALAVKSDGLARALEKLKAEELKVIESEKLRTLGELAAGIFHELHNHLNIICNGAVPLAEGISDLATRLNGESSKLATDLKEDLDGTRELATHVLAAAQAARGVTADLKGYAYQDKQLAVSDLNAVVESTLRIFGTGARAKGQVKLALSPMPVPVHCTPTRLQQVFTNLIKNAVEAMNGSGEVTIETSVDGHTAIARVTDNGPGIAPANQASLFEPFFTTKKQGEGLGLGLSLSRKVLHDLGGDLRYDAAHVGGASFVLSLPLADGGERHGPAPSVRNEAAA